MDQDEGIITPNKFPAARTSGLEWEGGIDKARAVALV
jgi:hypothetical protein